MRNIIAALAFCLFLLISPVWAQTDRFVGNWKNPDERTRGITRLNISSRNGKIQLHVYGKCAPRDCDWGTSEAIVYAPNVDSDLSRTAHSLTAIYTKDFAVTIVVIHPLENGHLRAEVFTRFTDRSRRSNISGFFLLKRDDSQ